MKSLQSLAGQIHLNEPLPYDVLDAHGQPLLRKGFVITESKQFAELIERGVYIDRDEFDRHKRGGGAPPPPEQFDPFWRWDTVDQRLRQTLREHVTDPDFVDNITKIAEEIDQLTEKDTDAGIFAMVRLDTSLYPIAHSLRTAFVSGIIARGLDMSTSDRAVLLMAALSMNIAMIELQKILYRQSTPLTEAQHAEVKTHPTRGRQHLEAFGVRDGEWLRAVAEHHEAPDSHGYPFGITAISPLAEVIRHADLYCAMTSGRIYRKPLPPNQVARELFVAAASSGTPIPSLIIKRLGIYPPGSFVKLANGEIAVVAHCGESAKSPRVCSLQNRGGDVYVEPVRRDTAVADFSVVETVWPENIRVQINPRKLFGYET